MAAIRGDAAANCAREVFLAVVSDAVGLGRRDVGREDFPERRFDRIAAGKGLSGVRRGVAAVAR
jgi:hypothetical protein